MFASPISIFLWLGSGHPLAEDSTMTEFELKVPRQLLQSLLGGKNGWAWKPYREFVPMKTIERDQTRMTWADCNGPDKEEPISFEKAAIRSRRIEVSAMNIPVGSNKCRCSSCDEYFLTVAAFEAHRVVVSRAPAYRRSCANPQGSNWPLHRDQKGYWRLPKREYIVKEAA